MCQNEKTYVIEKTKELLAAASCCAEAKAAAQNWLDAIGTEEEAKAAEAYVKELEADIMPIEGLLAFANSEMGVKVFGAETAAQIAVHAEERKAAGEKYCDCPACAAVEAILEKKEVILK